MSLVPGDIAKLSQSLINFFEDFHEEEEVLKARDCIFLIVETNEIEITALSSDGLITKFTNHDLEPIRTDFCKN